MLTSAVIAVLQCGEAVPVRSTLLLLVLVIPGAIHIINS